MNSNGTTGGRTRKQENNRPMVTPKSGWYRLRRVLFCPPLVEELGLGPGRVAMQGSGRSSARFWSRPEEVNFPLQATSLVRSS